MSDCWSSAGDATRRGPRVRDDEAALTSAIERLAMRYGRYGYRWIRRMLVDEGWRVNVKRVWRIWRREGLKVPSKPKRGRLWLNDGSCVRLRVALDAVTAGR
jgi:putative transposase